jgi:enoyl-CoA hydratase/carnithine racemase
MVEDSVVLERRGPVAILTLNRPRAMNAIDGSMFIGLSAALNELSVDVGVRSMVLTGAGKAFCSGADVNDPFFSDATRRQREERVRLGYGVVRQLRDARFPVIAAINGACVATGVSLAALCDIRIASSSAHFALGFARVGAFPDMAGSVVLPRLLGPARAIELTLLDEAIDAVQAKDMGLVTQVVEPDQLLPTALELGERLASRSPLATWRTRRAMTDLPSMGLDAALDAEAALVLENVESHDQTEGIAAFRQRRQPHFNGT